MRKRVLLLGAGYFGSVLLEYLTKQYDVTVLDRNRGDIPGVKFLEGEAGDENMLEMALEGADAIVNLLGGGGNRACMRDPSWAIGTYITANQKIAERVQVPMVLASSSAVYGQGGENTEEVPPFPQSVYGFLKLASEEIFRAKNIPLTVLRFSNLYGYARVNPIQEGGALGNFIARARKGEELEIQGDGNQIIDYVHVRDACCAILSVLFQREGVYNIGSGEIKTIRHVAETVLEVEKSLNPQNSSGLVFTAGESFLPAGQVSIEKAKKEFSWEPEISFEQGVREMMEKYGTA